MSDTPRTNQVEAHVRNGEHSAEDALDEALSFARNLERELAVARALLKKVWHCHTHPLSPQEQWDNLQRFLNKDAAPGGEGEHA